MSGLDYLLVVLKERGLSIEFLAGTPRLSGRKEEATDALRAMLALYRDEIIERLRPPETTVLPLPAIESKPPMPPLREWQWPNGFICRETDIDPAHRHESHPSLAARWRHEGETEWKNIECVED